MFQNISLCNKTAHYTSFPNSSSSIGQHLSEQKYNLYPFTYNFEKKSYYDTENFKNCYKNLEKKYRKIYRMKEDDNIVPPVYQFCDIKEEENYDCVIEYFNSYNDNL